MRTFTKPTLLLCQPPTVVADSVPSQAAVDVPPIEPIGGRPAHQRAHFCPVVVDNRVRVAGVEHRAEDRRQPRRDGGRVVALTQVQVGPRPAAALRRCRPCPAGTGRVDTGRVAWQDLLDPQVVAPVVAEVILIGEALAPAEREISQADPARIIGEAYPAGLGDAECLAVDDEAMQVRIGLASVVRTSPC